MCVVLVWRVLFEVQVLDRVRVGVEFATRGCHCGSAALLGVRHTEGRFIQRFEHHDMY
jgi:hypothetical protein